MAFELDTTIHWTEHYVRHGFCVIRSVVDRAFCDRGIAVLQKAMKTQLPPEKWSTETLKDVKHSAGRVPLPDAEVVAYCKSVCDEKPFRELLNTMHGGPQHVSDERAAHMFVCVFDPNNKPEVASNGHVDFVRVRIPIIGNACTFQVSLVKTERYSGNITIYPGLHKKVQKRLLEEPGFWYGENETEERKRWLELAGNIEPYEFIANPGDVLFFHHLVGHAGNVNAAPNRLPRVAIHGQAIRADWPSVIDPNKQGISPWERSLAQNGPINLGFDERAVQAAAYAERRARRSDVIPSTRDKAKERATV